MMKKEIITFKATSSTLVKFDEKVIQLTHYKLLSDKEDATWTEVSHDNLVFFDINGPIIHMGKTRTENVDIFVFNADNWIYAAKGKFINP